MKKDSDILMIIFFNDLTCTRGEEKSSKRKNFPLINLPIEVVEMEIKEIYPPLVEIEEEQNEEEQNEEEQNEEELDGERFGKDIIPSNIIGIYTRTEVFLGLKLSSQKDTLTEASFLTDEL